jgi:hypothetical protein
MSAFLYLNVIIAAVAGLAALYAGYLIYTNHKQKTVNNYIAKELSEVMLEAQKVIKKERKKYSFPQVGQKDLGDPAILSTLITVLIYKLGDVRLNVLDFARIPDNEYISVYVDTVTNDVILSLNHDLETEEITDSVLAAAKRPDDDIYH